MPTLTSGKVRNAGAVLDALQAEKRAVPAGVAASAEPIQAYIEGKVSVPFPPASAPGMPAHKRTGKYQRAWKVKAKGLTLTISNNAKHARFLEGGTKFMKARPALTHNTGGGGARRLVRNAGRSAADSARRLPNRRANG